METLRTLSNLGMIICGLGILGSLFNLLDNDISGIIGLLIYGYFLAYIIVSLKVKRE